VRTIPTVTPSVRLRRYRRSVAWLTGTSMAVVFACALVVIPAWRSYNREDLFDEYRAGYAAVVPVPIHSGDNAGPCDAAVLAAYPESGATAEHWTDQELAFWEGCIDRLWDHPSDPWMLRGAMTPDPD
jgi:hypothetical protein